MDILPFLPYAAAFRPSIQELRKLQLSFADVLEPCDAINDHLNSPSNLQNMKTTYPFIIDDSTARYFLWAVMLDSNSDAKYSLLPLDASRLTKPMMDMCDSARTFVMHLLQDAGCAEFYMFMAQFITWCRENWVQRVNLISNTHLYYDQRARYYASGELGRFESRVLAVLGTPLEQRDPSEWRTHEYLHASMIVNLDKLNLFKDRAPVDMDKVNAQRAKYANPSDTNPTVASGRCLKSYCYFLVMQDLLDMSSVEVWVRALAAKCGPCDALPQLLERMNFMAILALLEDFSEEHLMLAQTWIFEIPLIRLLRTEYQIQVARHGVQKVREEWLGDPPRLATHMCRVHAYLWNELYAHLLLD